MAINFVLQQMDNYVKNVAIHIVTHHNHSLALIQHLASAIQRKFLITGDSKCG